MKSQSEELKELKSKIHNKSDDIIENIEYKDDVLVVVSRFDEWNELFITEVVDAIDKFETDSLFGISYNDDVPSYEGKFAITVEVEPNNPRKYALLYGRIVGLSPTIIATIADELPEESDDPVQTFSDKIKSDVFDMSNFNNKTEVDEFFNLTNKDNKGEDDEDYSIL